MSDSGTRRRACAGARRRARPPRSAGSALRQDFTVDLGALPDGTDKVVFKALQTYSDGNIVRWIEEAQDGQKEPEHPAPVLHLTAATGGDATPAASAAASAPAANTAAAPAVSTAAAKASSSDSTARTLGIAGIAVGVLGAVTGVVLGRRSRKAGGSTASA
ncbi:DUF1775 domain-containing protein [Kitasatospora sp. NPDC001683]